LKILFDRGDQYIIKIKHFVLFTIKVFLMTHSYMLWRKDGEISTKLKGYRSKYLSRKMSFRPNALTTRSKIDYKRKTVSLIALSHFEECVIVFNSSVKRTKILVYPWRYFYM